MTVKIQQVVWVLGMLTAGSLLAGCATEVGSTEGAGASGEVATRNQAIFGGEPSEETKYAAVGALAIKNTIELGSGEPPFIYYDSFCTGTLVADTAVLTAKHCTEAASEYLAAGLELYFTIGSSTFEPEQALPIVGWKEALDSNKHPGLLLNGGRDVAVAYLGEEPVGVVPAKLGVFKDKQRQDDFEIIGFGYNDYYLEEYGFYDIGTKMAGKAGGRSLGGPWYSLLFNGDYDAYFEWYLTDADTGGQSPTPEQALEWWNIYNLEPGYELLAGGRANEALACFGDSGGPLAVSKKNKLTVYGVSFAVEGSQSTICNLGGAYLVLNEKMHAFVEKAIAHCHH